LSTTILQPWENYACILSITMTYTLTQHAMLSNVISSKHESYICADSIFTVNIFSPSAFQFLLVVNVLFKYQKKQLKLLAVSGCTWLVKQRPLLLNSWLTHLCMRHMVDQKVLY